MDKESSIGKVKKIKSQPSSPLSSRYLSFRNKMVKSSVASSVTKQEIAYYWNQRRMVEEEHLQAALKAAARVRARNLSEADMLRFEASLEDDTESPEKGNRTKVSGNDVGIRDWWTKSRYAYLNQPDMKLVDGLRERSFTTGLPVFLRGKCTYSPPTPTYGHPAQPNYQVK